MDKDRFNALLADIDQITGDDIKSLNQLRKQYPYFQNQYVMIARALKKRNHPKTDAFIKKAAIYSADRALLKAIITDEHIFAPPSPEPAEPAVEKTIPPAKPKATVDPVQKAEAPKTEVKPAPSKPEPPKSEAPKPVPVKQTAKPEETKKPEVSKPVPAKPKENRPAPASVTKVISPKPKAAPQPPVQKKQATKPETPVQPVSQSKEPETTTVQTSTDQQMIDELEKDLKEIREKKRLIAKMLEQNDAKQSAAQPAAAEKKSAKPGKKSQSELIEKFIQNEPQMEKQKLIQDESNTEQVDLASKNLKPSDDFHTETLARLMVKQKKYKKAIKIYEKLGLKFPEKRTYFASQIEKVNKKSNV